MNSLFLFVLIFAELLVVLGAWYAYRDHFLTVREMQREGVTQGLPFLAHAGMWGDFFLVSPLIAYILLIYAPYWDIRQYGVAFIVGLSTSAGLHYLYTKIEIPESHVRSGRLTRAGWVHFVYMTGAMMVLCLYYFCTPTLSYLSFIVTSVLIMVHVLLSNHIVLEIVRPSWYGKHHYKDSLFVLVTFCLILFLAWRCYSIFA